MPVRFRVGDVLADALTERLGTSPAGDWLRVDATPSSDLAGFQASPDDRLAVFDDVVPLGGRQVRLRSSTRSGGYLVEAGDLGAFEILPGGGEIRQVVATTAADPATLVELALGPPLALALALRRRWCLHASGTLFAAGDGVFRAALFLGDSGLGKSTLAGAFGAERIADDIVPVAAGRDGAMVFPRFPQLKLRAEEQGSELPEVIPLAAVYLLASLSGWEEVAIRRLAPAEAALALVRATVASRLMSDEDLRHNLEDAGRIAGQTRVASLGFERRLERLSGVVAAVRGDLRGA